VFNKSTRSYFFRQLVVDHAYKTRNADLSWREARLMFKGATVAAIYRQQQEGLGRRFGR
jgi:hypothetical protein